MRHIPDQIYLQLYGADQRDMEDTQEAPEITWCKDLIYDTDELYVRHTHLGRALREKDALLQQLRRLRDALDYARACDLSIEDNRIIDAALAKENTP